MRIKVSFWGAFVLLISAVAAQTVLTNDSIMKMAKAGLGDDIVVSTINAQPGQYSTSADDLIALKGAGVSDKVIAAARASPRLQR